MRFLAWLLTHAVALAVAAQLFDGIAFDGPDSGMAEIRHKLLPLLGVAIVMGVVNAIVRPVLTFISLPVVILTLGLFLLIINALMLKLTSWLAGGLGIGFHVEGLGTAVGGALVITVVTWAVDRLLEEDRRR
ncbi:phage holin family protein [Nocardioides sp. Kera G14]|uniref:phage holin family protein n=1 Tax=Nocardioides sp. Kera G14 TaxID=2884264 RepID=UPI001D129376|nr:phage holin family protein [Nocardioides sp. Kera G14]UDY23265.1 phage holin family protein [Nocardioides sp. Kera G14]